jgi:hypothetical protein
MLLWTSSVLGEEEEPYKSSSIQTLGLQVRRFSWSAKRMQGESTPLILKHICTLQASWIWELREQEYSHWREQTLHYKSCKLLSNASNNLHDDAHHQGSNPKIYNIQSSTFHVFNNEQVLQESHFNSIFITKISLSLSLNPLECYFQHLVMELRWSF